MIKVDLKTSPRTFKLGNFTMIDHGKIHFMSEQKDTNEFFSLTNAKNMECDIAATSWGYYLGPSLNSRLKNQGFRSAIMVNKMSQLYIVAIDEGEMEKFNSYIKQNDLKVITWLDDWLQDSKVISQFSE